jgi:hypothetical protein
MMGQIRMLPISFWRAGRDPTRTRCCGACCTPSEVARCAPPNEPALARCAVTFIAAIDAVLGKNHLMSLVACASSFRFSFQSCWAFCSPQRSVTAGTASDMTFSNPINFAACAQATSKFGGVVGTGRRLQTAWRR